MCEVLSSLNKFPSALACFELERSQTAEWESLKGFFGQCIGLSFYYIWAIATQMFFFTTVMAVCCLNGEKPNFLDNILSCCRSNKKNNNKNQFNYLMQHLKTYVYSWEAFLFFSLCLTLLYVVLFCEILLKRRVVT